MIRKAIIALLTLGAVGTAMGATLTINRSIVYVAGLRAIALSRGRLIVAPVKDLEGTSIVARPNTEPRIWLPTRGSTSHGWSVVVPLWMIFVLFAAYPTIVLLRRPVRHWRRRRNDLCVNCAYDLTGNVSGICPECGTAITSA